MKLLFADVIQEQRPSEEIKVMAKAGGVLGEGESAK